MLKHQNESGPRIGIVMDASPCKKHKAAKGDPCWTLRISADKRLAPAVCGNRVKLAGFTAPASPESLGNTPSGNTASKPPQRFKSTKQGRPRPTSSPSRSKDNA